MEEQYIYKPCVATWKLTYSALFAVMDSAVGRSNESSVNAAWKALTRTSVKWVAWVIKSYCT